MESSNGQGSGDRTTAQGRGARPTEITALLGRGTAFEGKLHFVGRVRVDGHFVGDIQGEDVLVIGEGADIEGTIEVGTCIVTAGDVRADIRARDAIELYPPARVTGSLHAPAIFIDRGVKFEGSCTMAPLDAPAQPRAAIRPSVAPDVEPGSELDDEEADDSPSPSR
jgi:cytoskeletal protein CcmA (bactofilin family)